MVILRKTSVDKANKGTDDQNLIQICEITSLNFQLFCRFRTSYRSFLMDCCSDEITRIETGAGGF